MKIGQFVKNLWNRLKHDETGQLYSPYTYTAPGGLTNPSRKPINPPPNGAGIPTGYNFGTPTTTVPTGYNFGTPTTIGPTGIPAGYNFGVTPATTSTKAEDGSRNVGAGGTAIAPIGDSRSSSVSSVAGFPTYTTPGINLNIPDFAWNPTEVERADWLAQAQNRAGLIIDPQRQQEIESLEKFKNAITRQIGEINPRYDKMSMSIANIIDNTIKQDIIDELIRRGATTSGEMEKQLAAAGRYEVEQRTGIENERNQLINALQGQGLEREELSGGRLAELERLRGMTEAEEVFQEERYQRGATTGEKQLLFDAELAQAELQNAVAARQYEAEYNKVLFEAQMAQQDWERGQADRQFGLQQANSAYSLQNQVDPYRELEIEQLRQKIEYDRRLNEYLLGQLPGVANQNDFHVTNARYSGYPYNV